MICFLFSSFALMWIRYNPLAAFVVNLVLLAFLLQFFSEGYDLWDRLFVDESDAVSHNMALLNTQKKQMKNFEVYSNHSAPLPTDQQISQQDKQEAALRNMSNEEYM